MCLFVEHLRYLNTIGLTTALTGLFILSSFFRIKRPAIYTPLLAVELVLAASTLNLLIEFCPDLRGASSRVLSFHFPFLFLSCS